MRHLARGRAVALPILIALSIPAAASATPASVYVANGTTENVSQYDIAATGALAPKSPATAAAGANAQWVAVTPDGKMGIAARTSNPGGTGWDLVAVPLGAPGPSRPILQSGYNENYAVLSPDGRWLAYVSDESNQSEVYVRPFLNEGGKVRVSQTGGIEPVWSRNGRELFYRSLGPRERQLMAAAIEVHPTLRVVSRTTLFDMDEYEPAVPHANYDVMPDGQRFRLGSGLSDSLRRQPPPVGTRITYRYQHLTKRGVPRFPRYLRVREDFPGVPE